MGGHIVWLLCAVVDGWIVVGQNRMAGRLVVSRQVRDQLFLLPFLLRRSGERVDLMFLIEHGGAIPD